MENSLHNHLTKSFRWYREWHDHPNHQHAHWAFFAIVSILLFSFVSGNIRDLNFDDPSSFSIVAHAQVGGINGQAACEVDIVSDCGPGGANTPTWIILSVAPYGAHYMYPRNAALVPGAPTSPLPLGPCPYRSSIPNELAVVQKYANLISDSTCADPNKGQGPPDFTFLDAVVTELHAKDPRWGYVRFTSGGGGISGDAIAYAQPPATPTPTPPPPAVTPEPRYIYYIQPYSILAGETILIVGQNLATTVSFRNASGVSVQSTGTINEDNSRVSAVVPSSLAPGYYNLSVGPNPDSNAVEIEVNSGTYDPGPTGGQTPVVLSLNPSVVSQGDTLEIMGKYLTPVVQFINTNGPVTTVTGSVEGNFQMTTVSIPSSLAPGIYTVAIVSRNGTGMSSDALTVLEANTAVSAAGISAQSLPSATPFQNLITNAFNYSLIVVGIAVFIMIMWGGFLWLTSAANPANLGMAKTYITNALLGAVLLVSAYVILYTINPELVGGGFTLPGIEAPPSVPPGTGGTVTPYTGCSNSQQPAAAFLTNLGPGNFSTSADCGGNNHALQNIQAMAGGTCPSVCSSSCGCLTGGTNGNITVDPSILAALNELRVTRSVLFQVTSFTTGEHSQTSYHYAGRAVDIVPNVKNSVVWGEVRAFFAGKGGTAICEISGQVVANCDNFSSGAHIHWQK